MNAEAGFFFGFLIKSRNIEGKYLKLFPAKNQASDWSTSSVSQSKASLLTGNTQLQKMVVDIGLKRPHCLIALFFKQTQSAKKCSYSKSSNLTEKEAEQYICCVHWSLVHIEIKFKNMVFGQQARVLYKYVNKYQSANQQWIIRQFIVG